MSFRLRQPGRRADMPPREALVPGDRLVIGRAADCDLALPDLAVELHHATLEQRGPTSLRLTARGPTRLDGREVTTADFDVYDNARITAGNYRLTVSRGLSPGELLIEAERLASAPARDDEEARVFGLKGALPSGRRMAWTAALIILAGLLVWPVAAFLNRDPARPAAPVAAPDALWTSGPLSRAHAKLEANCAACHVAAFEAAPDRACRACHDRLGDHAPLARQIAAAPPPARLDPLLRAVAAPHVGLAGLRCADCHREHEGGVRPVARGPDCVGCHAAMTDRLPVTPLANVPGWGTHPAFRVALVTGHDGDRPRLRRARLSDAPREASGLAFGHAEHLATGNAIAAMARALPRYAGPLGCADCHAPDARGGFRPIAMEADCGACHSLAVSPGRDLPHGDPAGVVRSLAGGGPAAPPPGRRRIPGDAAAFRVAGLGVRETPLAARVRAVFAPGGQCAGCHAIAAPPPNSLGFRVAPVTLTRHYLPGVAFDHRDHRQRDCAGCHAAATSTRAADLLLPDAGTCRDCHGQPAATPHAAPGTCATCHGYHPATG